MAYLNVREKVLEAKIAYVGAEGSGKRTTFTELRKRRGKSTSSDVARDDGTLVLDILPNDAPSFDDCKLAVTLHARPGDAALGDLLVGADGVVVVVDSDPSAADKNRRSIDAVREAVRTKGMPVVVQVNKTDLPGAVAPRDLVAMLDVADWPHVPATATSGAGVEETLDRLIADVVQSLTRLDPRAATPTPEPDALRGEGHPLLAALRRVLESTVEQHVQRLGEAVAARMEQRLSARLDALGERLDAVELGHLHVLAAARGARDDLAAANGRFGELIAATHQSVSAVDRRIAALESETELLRRQLTSGSDELLRSARHACSREDLATSSSDLRAEIVSSVEASTAGLREHLSSTVTGLRRVVDAMAADVKRATTKDHVGDALGKIEQRLDERTKTIAASLEAVSAASGAIGTRVSEGDAAITRELRESIGRRLSILDQSLHALATETESAATAVKERSERVEASLAELLEELKKPKKGWFG